jgi:hypothetical protein
MPSSGYSRQKDHVRAESALSPIAAIPACSVVNSWRSFGAVNSTSNDTGMARATADNEQRVCGELTGRCVSTARAAISKS